MTKKKLIGLYGGTFDPIHNGHIHVADGIYHSLQLDHVQFIPCKSPPHRPHPVANVGHRLNMLKLAVNHSHYFAINPIELNRDGPSYAIETVKAISEEQPNNHFAFILGLDSFMHFNQWEQWSKFLDYCHLIVINRPSYHLPKKSWLEQFLADHQTEYKSDLHHYHHGKILLHTLTPAHVSATRIREDLMAGEYQDIALPEHVLDYIQRHCLYV